MSSPRPSTLKFLTHWKWDAPARESPPPSPTYGKAPLLPEALTGPASLQLCSAVPAHATLNTALTLPRSPSGASSAGLPEAPLPGLDAPGTPCAHSRVSPGLCPRRGPGVPHGPKAISGGKQRPTRLAPGHISGQKQPARLWRAAAPPCPPPRCLGGHAVPGHARFRASSLPTLEGRDLVAGAWLLRGLRAAAFPPGAAAAMATATDHPALPSRAHSAGRVRRPSAHPPPDTPRPPGGLGLGRMGGPSVASRGIPTWWPPWSLSRSRC